MISMCLQASPLLGSRGSAPTALTSFLLANASSRTGIKETPMIAKITCRLFLKKECNWHIDIVIGSKLLFVDTSLIYNHKTWVKAL